MAFKIKMLASGAVFMTCVSNYAMVRIPRMLGARAIQTKMIQTYRLLSSDDTDKFPIFLHGEYHQKLREEMGQEEYEEYVKAHMEIAEWTSRRMRERIRIKNENEELRQELLKLLNDPFKEVTSTDLGQKMQKLLNELSKQD